MRQGQQETFMIKLISAYLKTQLLVWLFSFSFQWLLGLLIHLMLVFMRKSGQEFQIQFRGTTTLNLPEAHHLLLLWRYRMLLVWSYHIRKNKAWLMAASTSCAPKFFMILIFELFHTPLLSSIKMILHGWNVHFCFKILLGSINSYSCKLQP